MAIVDLVLVVLVSGAYPLMVKAIVDGDDPFITEAFEEAFGKFWTELGATILVGLIVARGSIALIVPGIILGVWYAYTVPAIMLENEEASEGMAISKDFSHDQKWSSFLMFLAVGTVYAVVLVPLFALGGSLALVEVVEEVLSVPVGAWTFVIISYTYITYGQPPVTAATGTSGYGMAPPTSTQQPSMQAGAPSPSSFCSSCGSPLQSGVKFCPN